MVNVTYNKQLTALVVIDPYNDFLSEGGKIWDLIRAVAEANECIPHMLQVLNAAREAELRVASFLCHASSIPSGGLRDMEVYCAHSEVGAGAKVL
jgi:ureidoacrylate peracid hydrolase